MSTSSIKINYISCIEVQGQTEISTIRWTVPNFIKLLETNTKREFHTEKWKDPDDVSESRFQLKMAFLKEDNSIIEIYYLSPTPVFLKLTMNIINFCRYEKQFEVTQEYHTVQANRWQYITQLRKLFIENERDFHLLSDGSLNLKFKFMVKSDIKEDRSNTPQLSSDFKNLLNNGIFSDVTMKSAEQSEYKVHKAILASRSTVLKAHFEHNTTECYTNVVESPLESEVLREVLTFIYSDKAPRVDEIPEKLLSAANYYQLSGLKSNCEEALHKKLTVENAIEILQLADLYSANTLKQLTLEFIKDQAKVITKTEAWSNVQSVELIKRIFEYLHSG